MEIYYAPIHLKNTLRMDAITLARYFAHSKAKLKQIEEAYILPHLPEQL